MLLYNSPLAPDSNIYHSKSPAYPTSLPLLSDDLPPTSPRKDTKRYQLLSVPPLELQIYFPPGSLGRGFSTLPHFLIPSSQAMLHPSVCIFFLNLLGYSPLFSNILKPPNPKNSSLNPGSPSSDHFLVY